MTRAEFAACEFALRCCRNAASCAPSPSHGFITVDDGDQQLRHGSSLPCRVEAPRPSAPGRPPYVPPFCENIVLVLADGRLFFAWGIISASHDWQVRKRRPSEARECAPVVRDLLCLPEMALAIIAHIRSVLPLNTAGPCDPSLWDLRFWRSMNQGAATMNH